MKKTVQLIPYPLSGPSVKSMRLQFRDKDVAWDSIKCFMQVKVGDVALSLSSSAVTHITEDHQVSQAQFAIIKVMFTNHSIFHLP